MKTAGQLKHARRSASSPVTRAAAVLQRVARPPVRLGVILGSGFQGVLGAMESTATVPYSKLPGFPRPAVPGHEGKVVCGRLGGIPIVVLAGRAHYYEGHAMEAVTFGVRVLAQLGVESLLITNAAGGLNPRHRVGDFMMLTDHINLMGVNPLRGVPVRDGSGFVDLTRAYDPGLQTVLRRAARRARVALRQGVYLAVSGPSYETPAEIRAFRRLGADAVGMSTVPEVIAARQHGVRVAALSCITNLAAGIGGEALDHAEVLATGARVSRAATRLIEAFATFYGEH
jgi:purine-nucleoside phosphorylase